MTVVAFCFLLALVIYVLSCFLKVLCNLILSLQNMHIHTGEDWNSVTELLQYSGRPFPVTDNNRKWLTRSPTGIPSCRSTVNSFHNNMAVSNWEHRISIRRHLFFSEFTGYKLWSAGKGVSLLLAEPFVWPTNVQTYTEGYVGSRYC